MLFFEIDFLLLFLLPLVLVSVILKLVGLKQVLPWIASAASIAFLYVFSAISVFIAVLSLTLNYFAAKRLLVNRSKKVLLATVAVNLLVLAYFKYSVFIDRNFLAGNSHWTWKLALPLGISFYTFQQIAFIADVYSRKVSSFSFKNYILFKLFFPQFVAGPITHFNRVESSYARWPVFNARSIRYGLTIFCFGLLKKLIGDYFGGIAEAGFSKQLSLDTYTAWISMLAFTFQIYFDFAGYSDMAVGLARLFGVNLPINFNSPYKARSLSDFWKRWHITLSRWLRDYLYIPMGGNRHGAGRMALALFITMALGGLWHGANWTFVLWGVVHGLGLIAARFLGFSAPVALQRGAVFVFVMLTWVLFRSETLSGALQHYLALITIRDSGLGVEVQRVLNLFVPHFAIDTKVNRPEQLREVLAILGAALACFFAPNSRQLSLWVAAKKVHAFMGLEIVALASVLAILALAFVSPDTANAFIYFEF